MVFRTSLLMCVAANSQHSNLDISKGELDSFYDWLEGPEFGNHPTHRVPLGRLRSAEREAWRKICLKVHERTGLSQALEEVRKDYLFWTPILMGDPGAGQSATGEPRGKGKGSKWKGKGGKPHRVKGKEKGPPVWTGARQSWQSGSGQSWQANQGGKGKGRWARSDGNREYCWAWNKGSCRGNCNRLHRCCKTLRSGYPCNAKHMATACRNS